MRNRNSRRRIALVAAAWMVSATLATGDLHALSSRDGKGRGDWRDWLVRAAMKARCVIIHPGECDCP